MRARATKHAIFQALMGSVFLVGALAHALAPGRREQSSLAWMAALLVLSTFNIAVGSRTLVRLRRLSPRLWMAGAAAWGLLSTALVAFLVRR